MSNGYRVPYTIYEFNKVRTLFNNDNRADLEECLQLLSMWRSRMGDQTPVAITCSDLVVRLALEESQVPDWTIEERWKKTEALKMQHCIAIIRFINYVNEIKQPGTGQISIANACSSLGIPRWMVEIRHNASHSHVPALSTLRRAFRFSRTWLIDHFWRHSPDDAMRATGLGFNGDLDEANRHEEQLNRIRSALIDFMHFKRNNKESEIQSNLGPNPVLRNIILKEPYDFLRVFVESGFLVMNDQHLKEMEIKTPLEPGYSVPEDVQMFWFSLLGYLHQLGFTGDLVCNLLSGGGVPEEGEIQNDQHIQSVAWVKLVLSSVVSMPGEVLQPMMWARILHNLIANPGYFDAQLIERVMRKVPKLSDKRRRQVRRIMEISLSESLQLVEDSMSVKTVEDLQKLIKKDQQSIELNEDTETSMWTQCEGEDWAGLPLGLCPGQEYHSLSIIMDEDYVQRKDRSLRKRKAKVKLESIAELEEE